MKYWVITCSEDGTRVREFTKERLEAEMAEEGSGYDQLEFATDLTGDPNYWRGKSLLIKGEAVVPVVEQVVTKRRLP